MWKIPLAMRATETEAWSEGHAQPSLSPRLARFTGLGLQIGRPFEGRFRGLVVRYEAVSTAFSLKALAMAEPSGKFRQGSPGAPAADSPIFMSRTPAPAAGHAPRGGQPGGSGLLSGRVHVPLQSADISQPGQAVLPPPPASRRGGAGAVQVHGEVCRPGENPGPQHIGAT